MEMNEMDNQAPTNQSESDGEEMGSPIDAIISRVRSYAKNPRLATPETLQELLAELEDAKSYYDEEETNEPESDGKTPGLAIMIGMGKKGEQK